MSSRQHSNEQMRRKKPLGRNFIKLLSGVSLTMLGDGLTLLAIPWLATALTKNALYVSIVSAASTLPWLLFSIPVGVLIDRYSHKTLMVMTSVFRGIILAMLALLVYFGWINISLLIVFTFLIGMAKVVFDSAAQTTIPNVVGRDSLERANGYMVTSITTMDDIIGKGIGGLLISFGLFIPFMIDATTALITIPILWSIQGSFHKPHDEGRKDEQKPSMRDQLFGGITWVWKQPLIRGLALINIGLTTTFASIVAIQVLFIQENLGLGSAGFGLLMVIAAVGAIIAGQLSGFIKAKLGTKQGMLISVLLTGIALGSVGLMNNWVIVGVLYMIGNFSVVIWNVFRLSFLQRIVPEHLLGRVLSVFRFVSWGMSPIGMFLGGLIVATGESFVPRDLALRMPYMLFIVVQLMCCYLLYKLFYRKLNSNM